MNIAFLGVGLMGRPMAERLIGAGHRVFLFNRTRHKILDFKDRGAVIADTVPEAVENALYVILMLRDFQAVEDVLFPAAPLNVTGRTFVQMATIDPEESRSLKRRIESLGGAYFECPVLGSRDKAQAGELILMAGSTREQFETFLPVLKVFGNSVRHVGDVGKASALKLALNQLIIALTAAFSLSIGMVSRAGGSVDDFMAILRESALYAPTFDKKLPRIVSGDFSDPNFPVGHMLKDVRLILTQARRDGLDASVMEAVEEILKRAVDAGLLDQDYSAIAKVISPKC